MPDDPHARSSPLLTLTTAIAIIVLVVGIIILAVGLSLDFGTQRIQHFAERIKALLERDIQSVALLTAVIVAIVAALSYLHRTQGLTIWIDKNTRAFSQIDILAGRKTVVVLLAALSILPLYLGHLLLQLWPDGHMLSAGCRAPTDPHTAWSCRSSPKLFIIGHWNPKLDQRLIAIVAISGALGGYIHAMTAFGAYVGNREFKRSWTLWYIARPTIGGVLAVVTYFVMRSFGVLATDVQQAGTGTMVPVLVNPYAHAAIGALAGMFSKQATDKLSEVFDTLLKSSVRRADQLGGNTAPRIESIDPPTAANAPTADLQLTIRGMRFGSSATVTFGAAALPPAAIVSRTATEIKVTVKKELLNTAPNNPPQNVDVSVANSATEVSNKVTFRIT